MPHAPRSPRSTGRRALPRLATALLAGLGLAAPAAATWSIVAVNTRTGEVAVASATCLTNTDLLALTPALVVGYGASASQAAGDGDGSQRAIIFDGFLAGLSAQEILDELALQNGYESRQFGIVTLNSAPVSHTGSMNGAAAKSTVGQDGDVLYAIQGNVLAGNRVINRCETAFLQAQGDLSQRIMAAMEEARAYGGDGRCSCSQRFPTSCGSPPPDFEKSAHVGYIVVARIGDVDGGCSAGGCATGNYWLKLNVIGGVNSLDPVLRLEQRYAAFRRNGQNKPDGLTSSAEPATPALPADGLSRTSFHVVLRDLDGVPLDHGSAIFSAAIHPEDAGMAEVESIDDHGDGTYTVHVKTGTRPGTARFEILARQPGWRALLYPYPTLEVAPVTPLFCGLDAVDPAVPTVVPLIVNVPAAHHARYVVVGSASGTVPGVPFAGTHLPLNPDRLFGLTRAFAGGPNLPNTVGTLDANGHAEAAFVTPPGWALAWLGRRVDWSAILFTAPPTATPAVGFDVLQDVGTATSSAGGTGPRR